MGYKVIFASQAHARLEEIVRFIAQDDPQAAIRFGLLSRPRGVAQKLSRTRHALPQASVRASALVQAIPDLLSFASTGTGYRDHGFLALSAA